tara:strand:+ start:271 stop:1047 length:777 start_codon:yes stop_codon:yes gene_type:complete
MNTYNFIDNVGSVTIVENGKTITFGNNMVSVEPFGTLYLKVTSTSGALKVFTFSLDDNISLNGVLFTGTLDELHDDLTAIFFSGASDVSLSQLNPVDFAGWEHIVDGLITTPSLNITTADSLLTIDGAGSASNSTYLPRDIRGTSNLFNTTTNKIMPIALGDSYDMRLQVEIVTSASNPTRLDCLLDIGGGVSPTIVVADQGVALKAGVPHTVIFSFPIFCLGTFVANGGQFFLHTNTGSLTIGKRTLLLTRTSKYVA